MNWQSRSMSSGLMLKAWSVPFSGFKQKGVHPYEQTDCCNRRPA